MVIVNFMFIVCFLTLSEVAHALPMDWHGVVGMDTTLIDNYRHIAQKEQNVLSTGTQEVALAPGDHANASFQSYVFRLHPVIVINDAATFKGEIGTGYGRGGRLGDDSTTSLEGGFGNALYNINLSGNNTGLQLRQFYLDLYSDMATYTIGRQTSHWGLGAVHNNGEKAWDRHAHVRDGITMKIKLGNFRITPFWAKISSADSLTRATRVREHGFSFYYDNIEQDIAFGLLYSKKSNGSFNQSITAGRASDPGTIPPTPPAPLGYTDVKLVDLYFKKTFGNFSFAVELPLLAGRLGDIYQGQGNTNYKARAFILESVMKMGVSWKVGIDWGKVSGDSGNTTSFDAMYLHPNYQIANILFRYNRRAVANPNTINVYDSYITNAMYFKFHSEYASNKWNFRSALIIANADEVAKASSGVAFNHLTNKTFIPTVDQKDDLGFEIDLDLDYHWNTETTIGTSFGYLFSGDYFAYTNDPALSNQAENSFIFQLKTSVKF